MITKAVIKSFETAKKKNWNCTYWAVDIHDTIIEANYQAGNIPTIFFPGAKEILQDLSKRADVKLILFTCSHPHEIVEYLKFFGDNQIKFDFVNENPDVKTDLNGYGNYDRKFYANVILDDKAGFDPDTEWEEIAKILSEYPELIEENV